MNSTLSKGLNFLKTNIPFIIQFGCFVHLFNENIFEIQECYGPSMLPTLNIYGDYLFLDKRPTALSSIGLGDLIVFTSPLDPHKTACKRVIGMPGDTVCINPTSPSNFRKYIKLPKGRVWVQGDNATNSTDSRVYGPVPLALVKAKVRARVYPNPLWFDQENISNLLGWESRESLKKVDLEYLLEEN